MFDKFYCGANLKRVIHKFLFILVMEYIMNVYELHFTPIADLFESGTNQEYYEGCRGAIYDPTRCFYST
jgi:hypothetical protein